MKKQAITLITFSIFLVILTSGCLQPGTEVEDDDLDTHKTVTMTAKEHNKDIPIDTDWSDGYSLLYTSLNDGDTLIINDIVDEIFYDSQEDTTIITFEWKNGETSDQLDITFEGDLTNSIKVGDEVKISVTIKYVTFSYKGFNFERELYNEQWVSEEYFRSDADFGGDGFKPLPTSTINKV